MPRGKPFSAKQKKEQLQNKKASKRQDGTHLQQASFRSQALSNSKDTWTDDSTSGGNNPHDQTTVRSRSERPKKEVIATDRQTGKGALVTVFQRESDEEIQQRKMDATRPLVRRVEDSGVLRTLPYPIQQETGAGREPIAIFKRPAWSTGTTPAQLHAREEAAFEAWLRSIYATWPRERLNFFEHNIEVAACIPCNARNPRDDAAPCQSMPSHVEPCQAKPCHAKQAAGIEV